MKELLEKKNHNSVYNDGYSHGELPCKSYLLYLFCNDNVSESDIHQNTSELIDLLQEYGWVKGDYTFDRIYLVGGREILNITEVAFNHPLGTASHSNSRMFFLMR